MVHVRFYLIDQNDGVPHGHSGERNEPEQRDKAERLVGEVETQLSEMMPSGAVRKTRISREML